MSFVDKLLSVSSPQLTSYSESPNMFEFRSYGAVGDEVLRLLQRKNGFFAFESALHVFPTAHFDVEMTLGRWNAFELWRCEYDELTVNKLFFAEDAFGNQFCLYNEHVCSFDAETGNIEVLGGTIEEWAERIISEYDLLTGHSLLHEWQMGNGALPAGTRLMPKHPFILGGEFVVENLYALKAVSAMRTRGNLARQIKDLPDGASIRFEVIE